MDIGSILLSSILLFIIIFLAVRMAIKPLLYKQEEVIIDTQDTGLEKLRDIGVLSVTELDDVIEFYQKKGEKKENYEQYRSYEKILNELKEMGYFDYEEHSDRMDILKRYYKID